jgi:hypothetical protein
MLSARPEQGLPRHALQWDGKGYWLAASDGIFTFDATKFSGSLSGKSGLQASSMASFPGGYWILITNGAVYKFTHSARTALRV